MTEETLKQNLLLKQIDKNSNQEISVDEIKFFSRNQENILLLSQDLHKNDTNIKKTFEINLYDAYKDISKKKKLTTDEQLILQLYQKVFEKKITEKPNLSRIEYNINTEFNNIINWVKSAYPNEYNTLVENQTKIYEQKPEGERNEYIKYNTIFWAIGKYQQELQAENDILLKKNGFYEKMEIVLDPRIGKKELLETYGGREYFTCSTFFEWIATNQYPEYQKDQTILDTYNKEISNILQQFGYKNANVFQKDSQKYKEYTKEASKLSKEYNYEESIKYLKKHDSPEDDSQEKIKEYFDHVETTLKYSEAHNNLSQKYDKNTILKYQNTINEINKTQKKYPTFLDAIQRLSAYNKILQQKKNELNITDYVLTRYSTYVQDVKNSGIQTRSERLTKMKTLLEKEINGDSKNDFIFPNIKKGLAEQANKQEQTDKIWNAIKTVPEVYTVANFLVGAWNGVVDATISVGTGLGVLIMSAYKDEHQLVAQSDRAQKRNDFLKIGQSTTQKEPPVKDGKRNLNFDNGAAQLGTSVTNMLILLSGAGAIARGATAGGVKLGLNISQNIATKGGLFARATMQGLPNSFQEGLQQGLDKNTAWNYAMTQTLISSSLEMIAPNDMFFGNASIKSVLKQLGKEQGAKTLAKAFAKNISKEMGEEVIQESLQFAAERVINKIANNITDAHFETSMTWADFGTTAVLTALTTGIVSSKGSYQIAQNETNHTKTMQWIVSDQIRYNEYKTKLNSIISGQITNIDINIEQAQIILNGLETINNKNNTISKINNKNNIISNNESENNNSINQKLIAEKIQLPITNNKHEYGLYDKNGVETNRDSFSIEQQKKITIQAFKQSIVEDLNILGDINYVNKTGYAFSQDTKVPGDIDYAIENNPQKIQQMITKLKQLESEGKIKNLKFTHKIRQEEIISEPEIQENINTKELRITYDGLTIVGDNIVSLNREMFIEDGKGIFEINLNGDYIKEVDIDGKKVRFLTPEGYIPYAEDLLVTDLDKEFGETAKKLKVAKRIDDYIDALSVQENTGKKTTVFEKIINFIIGKQISKTKTQRMIESLKESDRYKNPNHVLHKQYVDAVAHLQKVVVFKIESIKSQQEFNKSSLEQKGEIISESRNIKERIKKYKSDWSQELIEQLKQDKIALEKKLLQQDLSIDENFYLLNEYYLLTQTEEYALNNISIDPKIVKANAILSTESRIAKAKELIGDITPAQEQAILEAHNQEGTIYNLNFSQLRARVDVLSKSGFNMNQIRILIENGICGQIENIVLDVNKDGVFDGSDVKMMSSVGIIETINSLENNNKQLVKNNNECFENLKEGDVIFFGGKDYTCISVTEKNENKINTKEIIVENNKGDRNNVSIVKIDGMDQFFVLQNRMQYYLDYIGNKNNIEDVRKLYENISHLEKLKTEMGNMDLGINYDLILKKLEEIGYSHLYENDVKGFINLTVYPFLSQNISGEITTNYIINFIKAIGLMNMRNNIEGRTINNFSGIIEDNIYGNFLKVYKDGHISQSDFEYVMSSENENIFIERAKNIFLKTGNNILIFQNILGIEISENNKKIIEQLPADVASDIVENFGRNQKMFQGVREGIVNKKEFRNTINQEAAVVANIIDTTIEKINKIENVAELTSIEIIQEIYSQINGMDGIIQFEIISKVNQYITNVITIEKYLNMPKYKNDPKRLLADMRGVPYTAIEGEVTVDRNGATLSFYINNELGYMKIYEENESIVYNSEQGVYIDNQGNVIKESGGFSSQASEIPELEKTLTVTNGAKGSSDYVAKTEVHETRHGVNSLIFRGVELNNPNTRAKDEIIAYMKDGSNKNRVYSTLTDPNGLYSYNMKEGTQERNDHVRNLKRDVDIAFGLQKANVPNYLDLLAITPRKQRPQLEKLYLQNTKKPIESFLYHSEVLIDGRLTNLSGYTKSLAQKIGFYNIVQKYSNKFESIITGDNSFIVRFSEKFNNLLNNTKNIFKNDLEISKDLNELGEFIPNKKQKPSLETLQSNSKNSNNLIGSNNQIIQESKNPNILSKNLEGVDVVFEQNPELKEIGTKEKYIEYIKTIFPKSEIKDILYHGSYNKNIDTFRPGKLDIGVHFGTLEAAKYRGEQSEDYKIYPVMLNVKEIKEMPDLNMWTPEIIFNYLIKEEIIKQEDKNYFESLYNGIPNNNLRNNGLDLMFEYLQNKLNVDGIKYLNKFEDKGSFSFIIFNPNNIHILGSKQDILGFKNYINTKK